MFLHRETGCQLRWRSTQSRSKQIRPNNAFDCLTLIPLEQRSGWASIVLVSLQPARTTMVLASSGIGPYEETIIATAKARQLRCMDIPDSRPALASNCRGVFGTQRWCGRADHLLLQCIAAGLDGHHLPDAAPMDGEDGRGSHSRNQSWRGPCEKPAGGTYCSRSYAEACS